MKHIIHKENPYNNYSTAILIKESALHKANIEKAYYKPLITLGIEPNSIITFSLTYNEIGKAPAIFCKEYLDKLLLSLKNLRVKNLLICDSTYFKILTKVKKIEPSYGYILDSKYITDFKCIICPNYQQLFYDPKIQNKLDLALKTLSSYLLGSTKKLGSDIIHSEYYPESYQEISDALNSLQQHKNITCDIETFNLEFHKAGIGTIAFAWNQHEGISFCVDYKSIYSQIDSKIFGYKEYNPTIRNLLNNFFKTYKGKIIYHGQTYDAKVLIYELFMDSLIDYKGLLKGLEIMTKNTHDTKIISYLALNSCSRVSLKLKELAHEFAGDYAQEDINNIRLISKKDLLKYNLIDCLSTWFIFNKYYPKMIEDNQLDVYESIMHPSIKLLLQTELSGMPICMNTTLKVEKELSSIKKNYSKVINESSIIQEVNKLLTKQASDKSYQDRKSKAKNPDKIKYIERELIEFNVNSNKHLVTLLYDYLNLKITKTTNLGLPATGSDVIEIKLRQLMHQFNLTDEDLI